MKSFSKLSSGPKKFQKLLWAHRPSKPTIGFLEMLTPMWGFVCLLLRRHVKYAKNDRFTWTFTHILEVYQNCNIDINGMPHVFVIYWKPERLWDFRYNVSKMHYNEFLLNTAVVKCTEILYALFELHLWRFVLVLSLNTQKVICQKLYYSYIVYVKVGHGWCP